MASPCASDSLPDLGDQLLLQGSDGIGLLEVARL